MPDKPQKWIVKAEFRDPNQPKITDDTSRSIDQARAKVRVIANTFAGLRSITILKPNGDKICFQGDGTYMFSIPASALKEE